MDILNSRLQTPDTHIQRISKFEARSEKLLKIQHKELKRYKVESRN